ncbi:neutral zinc metallopeptidase [Plantactinospora sp. GCM10030261]|uniref:neutral zinc metallopeptidase n=1 Tax=Plantactinospora sp. GCM10030261 TaxID=3273420 RepID=UPI003615F2E8
MSAQHRIGISPRLGALISAVALVLACGVGVDPDERGAGEPNGSPPAASGEQDGPEGTDTVEEFERDIRGAVGLAERYWGERFSQSRQRFQPIRQVGAYQREGEVACGGQPVPRNNAVYCSAGDFIAYDVNWALAAFRQVGDAFLFYLLGHEYAHGIQTRLGVRYDYTIQQELQADCMAGAYIGDMVRTGDLSLDDGDLDEFRTGLAAVADDPDQPWFAEGSHGSVEQRTTAFFNGYEDSLAACGLG